MAPQGSRRKHVNDKTLLYIFLAAAVVVASSIILVPLDFDDSVISGDRPSVKRLQANQQRTEPRNDIQLSSKEIRAGTTHRGSLGEHIGKSNGVDQQAAEANSPREVRYHTVFSTGCSTFQDWQSYVFFYHLVRSGQEGPVTRIASGCTDEQAEVLTEIFEREIAVMAPGRLHLHLTPDFSRIKPGVNFKYFNKPCGLQHWITHELGYPNNHAEHDDTIFILLDPDQILIRPFTNDFTTSSEKWKLGEGYKLRVEHGSPFAQQYGYGIQWKHQVDVRKVFEGDTPVASMGDKEARDFYFGMGPPYVFTGKDMHTIVETWSSIVARVHDDYPELLAEMFGYNLAAAHHGLRHTIAHSFMVSDVGTGGEGWKLIDAVDNKDVCNNFPPSELPHVLHYCQRYFVGKWFFSKYKLRKSFISCEAPLLKVPPPDIALKYNAASTPDGKYHPNMSKLSIKEHSFMICAMVTALNEASVYYKDHHCDKATANYEYSFIFNNNLTMPDPPHTTKGAGESPSSS